MPAYAACALGTQYATAFYSTSYVQNMRKGERALVHAATGGVGTALVQLLLAKGCEVFATAGSDEKVAALKKLGVHAFNYRTQDYEKEIDQLLNGKRLHASFNSIAGTTFKKDMRLLGANGRLVLYGFAERSGQTGGKWATFKLLWNMGFMMPIMLLATSKSIIGVNMLKIADHEPQVIQDCLQSLVKLWAEKTISPVNGGEYTPEQLGEAHAALEHRKVMGKAVVVF
jgi:NADPH2:quinone reductase